MTKSLTQEQFDRLTPYVWYWNSLKQSGSITGMQEQEKSVINDIHFELLGVKHNITCPNCIIEMVTYVYRQYDKFKLNQPEGKPKRKRINE